VASIGAGSWTGAAAIALGAAGDVAAANICRGESATGGSAATWFGSDLRLARNIKAVATMLVETSAEPVITNIAKRPKRRGLRSKDTLFKGDRNASLPSGRRAATLAGSPIELANHGLTSLVRITGGCWRIALPSWCPHRCDGAPTCSRWLPLRAENSN
jgi:hypothetical protein